MAYEVEQKYRVDERLSLPELVRQLESLGTVWSEPVEQIDRYFNHPARDFAQTDEAFRIRSQGNETRVTYKGPKLDKATKTRREIELPLASLANGVDAYSELFEALSFRRVAEVRKQRRSGQLTWQGTPFEVALDEVVEVGSFVELETIAESDTLNAARDKLQAFAAHLGLASPERRSYLEMLLTRRG